MDLQQNSLFHIDETNIKLETCTEDDFKQFDKISISNKIKQEYQSEDEQEICDIKFENINTLNIEIKQEPDIEPLKFEIKQEIDIEPTEYETQNYICNKCEFTTTLFSSFQVHRDECNKINTQHNKKRKIITNPKPICEICGKSFMSKHGRRKHMKLHADLKHNCNLCEKHFVCEAYLKKHMLIHKTEKLFSCNICNRHFICKRYLSMHLRTHSGQKRVSCKACSKAFIMASKLACKLDARIRTYECNACGKVYTCN